MIHPRKVLLLMLLLAAVLPALAAAEMRPVPKARPGVPPHDVLGEVFAANARRSEAAKREGERAPDLIWLTDCDANIHPGLIAGPGQRLFTVRTFGFQLASGLAAADYAIRHLHTPVLLVTGNSGNEAIRMFMEGSRQLEPEIRRELEQLRAALPQATAPASRDEFAAAWLANIERNVDYQVKQALDRYAERVADGRLVVAGTILDLDGAYGRGEGRLLLINLNGETDPEKIRRSPHLVRFPPEARELAIGRERE